MTEDQHVPYGIYEKHIKRSMDFILSVCAVIVLSPVIIITAICVKVNLGAPVIFKQDRVGLNGKIFTLYKFRSMTNGEGADGNLLSDDERLSSFGRKLRSTSLDELPELLNIIKGDMSIVGPRPLLIEYIPYYTREENRRHDVRPGLTGWAQINGRNEIHSWEERFKFDLEYVNHVSLMRDLKIIILTVYKVFKMSGIKVGSEIKAGRLDHVRGKIADECKAEKISKR